MLENLVGEWGVFLENSLFNDAILYFRGGDEKVVREIDITDGSRILGKQKAHLIFPDIAFKITSLTKESRPYENHLHRFIKHSPLRAIQWINFDHNKVVFKTILNRNH